MSNRSVFVLPTGQVLDIRSEHRLNLPNGKIAIAGHTSEKKSRKKRQEEFNKMRREIQERLRRQKETQNAHNR